MVYFVGVTWIFGLLAIEQASDVLVIPFCVLNSIQGFLIFVFYCLRSPTVRNAWRSLCCPSDRQRKSATQSARNTSSRISTAAFSSSVSTGINSQTSINRRWTNRGLVYWRKYTSLGLDELIMVHYFCIRQRTGWDLGHKKYWNNSYFIKHRFYLNIYG